MSNFDFNHVAGCIFGGALGDAFGIPVEFMDLDDILYYFGPKGLTIFSYNKKTTGVARFSDDTAQTVFTADGLLKSIVHYGFEAPLSLETVHRSYRDWFFLCIQKTHPCHGWITQWPGLSEMEGGGSTTVSALTGKRMGTLAAPLNDSSSCGGVMRSAPCGLVYWEDTQRAFQAASDCTLITHGNPDAYLSAGAYAAIIAELIQGKTIPEAVDEAVKILKTRPGHANTLAKINQAIELTTKPLPPCEAIEEIGLGYFGTECLAIAVYCALKTPNDFHQTLINAVNHSGDSDTVGSVAGGIVGTYLGLEGIPADWPQHLCLRAELETLSRDILTIPTVADRTEFAKRYPI